MKKEMKKGDLLWKHQLQIDWVLNQLRNSLPDAQSVCDRYAELGFGKLDQETYKALLSLGVAAIAEKYENSVERDIDRLQIRSVSVTRQMLNGINSDLNPLQQAITHLNQPLGYRTHYRYTPLGLEKITVQDGRAFISLELEKEVQEAHSVFLDNVELYNKLSAIQRANKEFVDFIQERGYVFGFQDWIYSDQSGYLYEDEVHQLQLDGSTFDYLQKQLSSRPILENYNEKQV